MGLFLDVRFKTVSITAEVHRYRLIINYTNTMKEAQEGWKLKIYFPSFLPLFTDEYDRSEILLDGEPYVRIESCSNQRVFPGESIEVVPRDVHFIEYEVNDNVYDRLRFEHKVRWQFFTPNAPVIEGEKPLCELQEF